MGEWQDMREWKLLVSNVVSSVHNRWIYKWNKMCAAVGGTEGRGSDDKIKWQFYRYLFVHEL